MKPFDLIEQWPERVIEETPEKEGDLTRDDRFKKIFAS